MPVYRNTTDQDLVLPNIGIAKAGETITVEGVIENGNFELVSGSPAVTQEEVKEPEAPAKEETTEDKKEEEVK